MRTGCGVGAGACGTVHAEAFFAADAAAGAVVVAGGTAAEAAGAGVVATLAALADVVFAIGVAAAGFAEFAAVLDPFVCPAVVEFCCELEL